MSVGPKGKRMATILLSAMVALALPSVMMSAPALAAGCAIVPLGGRTALGGDLDDLGNRLYLSTASELVRHLPDGRLDRTFSGDGVLERDALPVAGFGTEIAPVVQGSRTILVGTRSLAPVLLGFTGDGSPDARFGSGGVVELAVPDVFPVDLAAAPNGQLVLLLREYGAGDRWAVARLTATGALDQSFGDGGLAWFNQTVLRNPMVVAVHADGRIVVGARDLPSGGMGVVGLTAAGALQETFGSGGSITLPGVTELLRGDLETAPDGSTLVLASGARPSGPGGDLIFRLRPDGRLDETFGEGGSVLVQGAGIRAARDIALDAAGRVLFARGEPTDPSQLTVVRLDASGTPDASFNASHRMPAPTGVTTVVPGPDGEVVVFGTSFLVTLDATGGLTSKCAPVGEQGAPKVQRLAGTDRFGTAVEIARNAFPRGASTVFLATATQFPDALAAVPAAARAKAPVLLVQRDVIPASIAQELQRLAPQQIIVLGGPAAVSEAVVAAARSHAATVRRISGADRFATAAAISAATFAPGVPEVYIATGRDFPDALAGGAAAGLLDIPILLVTRDSVPVATADELTRLRPGRVTVLGGTSAVSEQVADKLADRWGDGYPPGGNQTRISGASRFSTAAAIAKQVARGASVPAAYLATGSNFPDALAAGSAAALSGAPLLLVPREALIEVVRDSITRLSPEQIVILGGTGVIADPVEQASRTDGTFRYLFNDLRSEREPQRWNPCEPIHWVYNPTNGPAAALADATTAVARISAATGIPFVYDGISNEPSRHNRQGWGHQPQRYGDGPSPLLIAFGDLSAGTAGLGGWLAVGPSWDSTGAQIVAGFVTLDVDDTWTTGFLQGDATGPILLHELGHVLGLGHVDYPQEQMYPRALQNGNLDFGSGDRLGLRTLGVGSSCLPSAKSVINELRVGQSILLGGGGGGA